MMVHKFTVGRLFSNCYIAVCKQTKEAVIIDPGFDTESEGRKIFEFIKAEKVTLKFIVNTHGHFDHTCGNGLVKKVFNAPILIHEEDAYMLGDAGNNTAMYFGLKNISPVADVLLKDGDTITFGRLTLKVIHTPGHTYGCVSLSGQNEVFTGDTLFAGSIGRTDLFESSKNDMKPSLRKLANLPSNFIVYPGHGSVTTISEETRNNPFFQLI
jgi:glyoxylase-like metal-dependent hydrolase (beta-lactamase superfamily II)